MRLVEHESPAAFLDAAQATLERHEAEHSLILGVALARRAARAADLAGPAAYYATAHDPGQPGDGVALAALVAPSFPLLLASGRAEVDDVDDAALRLVAAGLRDGGIGVAGVVAAAPVARRFADAWAAATGARPRVRMQQRLHRLTAVAPVPAAPGAMRLATSTDADLVAGWIAAFHDEAFGAADRAHVARSAASSALRRIGAQQIYLWDDGAPRAMAARDRPTAHGETINAVYTPPASRGRGLATALVAALSRRLLDEGRAFCALFTDLANPTSNAVYARVGYEPVRDFTHYVFEGASE